MKRAVTLQSVAARSGFHYSTVSLALRGDPRIRESTRETILAVARELGYQPDPMLKALSVYRKSIKPEHYHATLAWITTAKAPEIHREDYVFRDYVKGAKARADELGYRIEEFAIQAPGMTLGRLKAILKARGIDGILVAPLPGPRSSGRINLDWSHFHAVSFGYTLAWPSLHRITTHHSAGAKLALRKVTALGYKRVGLVIDSAVNERVDGNWLGGYLAFVATRGMEPHYFLRRGTGSAKVLLQEEEGPMLKEWILQNQLDALIFDYSGPFVDWLRDKCGLRVPQDIGVVSLNVQSRDTFLSGIDQNEAEIGWYAMDTLVNMINTHERGVPAVPHKLLIDGTWRQGQTVQRLNSH